MPILLKKKTDSTTRMPEINPIQQAPPALTKAHGQVIATSETYERKQSALNGIESVKANAPGADVDDQTGESLTFLLAAGGGLYWLIPAAVASLLGGVVNAWLFLVKVTS